MNLVVDACVFVAEQIEDQREFAAADAFSITASEMASGCMLRRLFSLRSREPLPASRVILPWAAFQPRA
jgi:hypothetical protein